MRFRVKPAPEVADEIERVEKKVLIDLLSRAARRMADGDEDTHIERAVTWEGHSEEFAKWVVQEVRASFSAFGLRGSKQSNMELGARAATRLAMLMLLVLAGAIMLQDRDSIFTLIFLFPVILLAMLYALGFSIAMFRLIGRWTGKDEQEH